MQKIDDEPDCRGVCRGSPSDRQSWVHHQPMLPAAALPARLLPMPSLQRPGFCANRVCLCVCLSLFRVVKNHSAREVQLQYSTQDAGRCAVAVGGTTRNACERKPTSYKQHSSNTAATTMVAACVWRLRGAKTVSLRSQGIKFSERSCSLFVLGMFCGVCLKKNKLCGQGKVSSMTASASSVAEGGSGKWERDDLSDKALETETPGHFHQHALSCEFRPTSTR